MSRIIFNQDLVEYRVLEMLEGAKVLQELEKGNCNLDYYKGAMAMLKKIIEIPKTQVDRKDKDQIELANDLMKRAWAAFDKAMIHKSLEENTVAETQRD